VHWAEPSHNIPSEYPSLQTCRAQLKTLLTLDRYYNSVKKWLSHQSIVTYAHCSMLASACNMTARFFLFITFPGSTVFFKYCASRVGTSGGFGVLTDLFPIDVILPVRHACTA